ncbi:MAG TPA: hypothetical protein VIM57_09875 [Luteolibacter sp.]
MKPNILVIDASSAEPTPAAVELSNRLARHGYVYLICPGCGFREDTDEGVRFLSHELDAPPNLGKVDGIVTLADVDSIATLLERYPHAPVFPEPRASQVPAIVNAVTASRPYPAGRRNTALQAA